MAEREWEAHKTKVVWYCYWACTAIYLAGAVATAACLDVWVGAFLAAWTLGVAVSGWLLFR